MNRALCICATALVLLVAFASKTCAKAIPRTAQPSDFVRVWHGYSASRLEFVRLELSGGGKGLMAVSYLPEAAVRIYRIRWQQTGHGSWALAIVAKAAAQNSEPVTVQVVRCEVFALTLQLCGKGWKREFILCDEKKLESRAISTRNALQKLRGKAQ